MGSFPQVFSVHFPAIEAKPARHKGMVSVSLGGVRLGGSVGGRSLVRILGLVVLSLWHI
jgi:hypothetical protein